MKDLEKEITCAICHDHYTDPKILPCLHYYCKQCIHGLAKKAGPFSCPECRKETTLSQEGVDNLPTAFFVNRMKEVHSKMDQAQGKVDTECEVCEICYGDKVKAFCQQCGKFICSECIKQHRRMKALFPGHKITQLRTTQEPTLRMCEDHDEPMKIYCFDCNVLICRDCTIKDHLNHNHEFIKKAAPAMKKELVQELDPLKEVVVSLSDAVEKMQTTESEIEARGNFATGDIENVFEELQAVIKAHKQKLLEEATMKVTQKLQRLSEQKKELSATCATVKNVIEDIEQCVKESTDGDVLCVHAKLKNRITTEVEKHCKKEQNLEPVENVDFERIDTSCIEDVIKQLKSARAELSPLPVVPVDPSQCTVTVEEAEAVEVYKATKLSLKIKSGNKKSAEGMDLCAIECTLKSQVNPKVAIKCNVYKVEDDEYCIQFTPTIRGRHQLVVVINGEEVTSSPFPVFVSIIIGQPTIKLEKPLKTMNVKVSSIHGECYPVDMAFNSLGEIIIASSEKIEVRDKHSKILKSIMYSDYGVYKVYTLKVAVDSTNNIYVLAVNSSNSYDRIPMILKLNKKLELVNTTRLVSADGTLTFADGTLTFAGVAVVDDRVLVYTYGSIHIYTPDLEHVEQITSPNHGSPGYFSEVKDMSSDKIGNLYILASFQDSCQGSYPTYSSSSKSRLEVVVFSSSGKYLHSLKVWPVSSRYDNCSMCVAGKYVYFAEGDKNSSSYYCIKVRVYSTDGPTVTIIEHVPRLMDTQTAVRKLHLDEDGFIYVLFNSDILVF